MTTKELTVYRLRCRLYRWKKIISHRVLQRYIETRNVIAVLDFRFPDEQAKFPFRLKGG